MELKINLISSSQEAFFQQETAISVWKSNFIRLLGKNLITDAHLTTALGSCSRNCGGYYGTCRLLQEFYFGRKIAQVDTSLKK